MMWVTIQVKRKLNKIYLIQYVICGFHVMMIFWHLCVFNLQAWYLAGPIRRSLGWWSRAAKCWRLCLGCSCHRPQHCTWRCLGRLAGIGIDSLGYPQSHKLLGEFQHVYLPSFLGWHRSLTWYKKTNVGKPCCMYGHVSEAESMSNHKQTVRPA